MNTEIATDIKEFLERTSTKTFLFAAREFVALLETTIPGKEEFCSKAHTALLELYSAAHKLDQIELKYSSAESDFDRDTIFENKNIGQISELGQEAFYWEIFDPTYSEREEQPNTDWTISDREASQGWLVDDFADIYRDLKIELIKLTTLRQLRLLKTQYGN
jgi:hypothetical protein